MIIFIFILVFLEVGFLKECFINIIGSLINISQQTMLILQTKLITLDIFYYLPDYPSIIQEFVWQTEDRMPEMPRIKKFLNHWKSNIEGNIKEVYMVEYNNRYRMVDLELFLN